MKNTAFNRFFSVKKILFIICGIILVSFLGMKYLCEKSKFDFMMHRFESNERAYIDIKNQLKSEELDLNPAERHELEIRYGKVISERIRLSRSLNYAVYKSWFFKRKYRADFQRFYTAFAE
jgi:hypothetical protein